MKTERSLGRAGAALLGLSIIFGITLFSGVTAQAQNGDWRDGQYRRDRDRDYERDRDRDDRDRRREREERWRRERRNERNNGGYYGNGGYGTYGGYGRNGDYGHNGRYGNYGYDVYQIAADRGYQDGLSTGQEDAYRDQNYDPQRSHYYKNGTYGYNSSYGSKGQYKQAYRDGFLRGYRDGYSRNGRYGRNGRGTYGRSRVGDILGGIFGRP